MEAFNIVLNTLPVKTSYTAGECESLVYTTTSLTAKGGVDRVKINSGGYGYKKLPNFVGSSSSEGEGALIVAESDAIGNINKVRIIKNVLLNLLVSSNKLRLNNHPITTPKPKCIINNN